MFNTTINEIDKILKSLYLSSIFFLTGFIMMVISTFNQYGIGLKLGTLTLVFGGIFRVLNIIGSAFPNFRKRRKSIKMFSIAILKFSLYLVALIIYLYLGQPLNSQSILFNIFNYLYTFESYNR